MRKAFISLIAILISLLMISCSNNSTDNEVFDGSLGSFENGSFNFGGLELVIDYSIEHTGDDNFLGFETESTFGDSLISRISGIEKENNCSIRVNEGGELAGKILSGIHPADIIFTGYGFIRDNAHVGMLFPIDDYSDIVDYTDSFIWGTPNTLEPMMIDGILYGTYPASWPGHFAGYYFLTLSNNEILTANGYGKPHEYVENGLWTSEKVIEIANGCFDKEKPIYGFEGNAGWFYRELMFSNGIHFAEYDKNLGIYINGVNTQKGINGLTWAKGFYNGLKECWSNTGEMGLMFLENRAAFCMANGNSLMQAFVYNDSVKEFSVLPFPVGPDAEYGEWRGMFSANSSSLSIPITEENLPEAATLMTLVFAPFDGADTRESLNQYYTNNIFFDSRDIECLMTMIWNSEFTYYGENILGILDDISNKINTMSPAEAIGTYAPKYDSDIQKYIVPNKEGLIRYFGKEAGK